VEELPPFVERVFWSTGPISTEKQNQAASATAIMTTDINVVRDDGCSSDARAVETGAMPKNAEES
jgi:hypothetical protein